MPPLWGWTLYITEAAQVVEENAPIINDIMSLLISDFLIPVSICLILLGLWIGHSNPKKREQSQRHVMNAAVAIGISTLIVTILNTQDFWPRPFDPAIPNVDLWQSAYLAADIVAYHHADPPFPCNGATISFAAATCIWFGNRKAGLVIFILASLWAFARFYGGLHFFVDMAAGIVIGVTTAIMISKVFMPRTEPVPTIALHIARALYIA